METFAVGRWVNIVWVVLVIGGLVLLGQTLGLLDAGVLRNLARSLPVGQTSDGVAQPKVSPGPPTLTVRPVASPSPVPAATEACTPAAPRFVLGAATLKGLLGGSMGEPLECERVVDAAGNTEQRTTTGLVYYRAARNMVAFTNGWDHWALTPSGPVHWTGDDMEPPPNAEPLR
jgi:hypothetical protein